MFVGERFDVWHGSAVDAERFVVGGWHYTLNPKRGVLQEDARALVVRPMEGRVGVAVALLFFHGAFQNETI